MEQFIWNQSAEEVFVTWKAPSNLRARDFSIKIENRFLSVGIRNGPVYFQGQLYSSIRASESTWTLESNQLTLHLEKANPDEFWERLLLGNPEMQTTLSQIEAAQTPTAPVEDTPAKTETTSATSKETSPLPAESILIDAKPETPEMVSLAGSPNSESTKVAAPSSEKADDERSKPNRKGVPSAGSVPSSYWLQFPLLLLVVAFLAALYKSRQQPKN